MTEPPDLTGFSVVHRAMLEDVRRLAKITTVFAAAPATLTRARASAMSKYVGELAAEIHHHHSREDDIIWPVILDCAGASADLLPFTDDHRVLAPILDRAAAAAVGLRRDAARHIGELAVSIAELDQLLHDHIPDEEAEVFPLIRRFVPAHVWRDTERRMSKGVPPGHIPWLMGWIDRFATEQERRHIRTTAPTIFVLVLAIGRTRFASLERKVFA